MLRLRSLSASALALLLLVGCGGEPDTGGAEVEVGTPDEDGVLVVTGTDNLRWDPPALEAPAGEVTIELVCERAVNHNIVVGRQREVVAECRGGESATGTIELEPGEHPFVCTIPGHEARMRGTLTVS